MCEEIGWVKKMSGAPIDADPDRSIRVSEEGAFIGISGEQTVQLSQQNPTPAIEDVHADIGTHPQPAALIEADKLDICRDDVRGRDRLEQLCVISIDTEVIETRQATTNPE